MTSDITERSISVSERVTAAIELNGADLYKYLRRRTSSPEEAADAMGDSFLVIWRRKESLPPDPIEARLWCFGVARHVAHRYARDGKRQRLLQSAAQGEAAISAKSSAADPTQRMEIAIDVRAAVNSLPTKYQELVRLTHWDGFTIEDAAKLLKIKPSTARTQHARARQRLAALLAPEQ